MASPELERVLRQTEHRLHPLPDGPWIFRMRWHDLLFMHWPAPDNWLRPLVPPALELYISMAQRGWEWWLSAWRA